MPVTVVAVTGANGFVGRALMAELLQHGLEPRGLVRSATTANTIAIGDIGPDTEWDRAIIGVDTVIHCAARVHVMKDDAADPLAEFRKVNTEGTRRLAQEAVRFGVKRLVSLLEDSVIEWLGRHGIAADRRAGAPGVYVGDAKIAALGLRIRKGCCYHGLSFNVDMDLEPFSRIDPCGFRGLAVTQLSELGIDLDLGQVGIELAQTVMGNLGEKKSGSTGS